MSRVPRKYQRVDYTALLEELKAGTNSEPAALQSTEIEPLPAPVQVVSAARRRRDSLMSNPNMRYAFSNTMRVLHDRDCDEVKRIHDKNFSMLERFPETMPCCTICQRKALLRAAIGDDGKHIQAYLNIFDSLCASTEDLHTLIIKNHAKIHSVTVNSVQIKVRDDTWMLLREGGKTFLFHNNYQLYGDYRRFFQNQFHLQKGGGLRSFHTYLNIMCLYSWEEHVQLYKTRAALARQRQLRAELAGVQNAEFLPDLFSLRFRCTYLDCDGMFQSFCKKRRLRLPKSEGAELPFAIGSHTVWFWQKKRMEAALEDLKEYCAGKEIFQYAELCRTFFPEEAEQDAPVSTTAEPEVRFSAADDAEIYACMAI